MKKLLASEMFKWVLFILVFVSFLIFFDIYLGCRYLEVKVWARDDSLCIELEQGDHKYIGKMSVFNESNEEIVKYNPRNGKYSHDGKIFQREVSSLDDEFSLTLPVGTYNVIWKNLFGQIREKQITLTKRKPIVYNLKKPKFISGNKQTGVKFIYSAYQYDPRIGFLYTLEIQNFTENEIEVEIRNTNKKLLQIVIVSAWDTFIVFEDKKIRPHSLKCSVQCGAKKLPYESIFKTYYVMR